MGSIPDGFYEFIGQTLRIVSDWSPERQREFAANLKTARRAPDPRRATAAALEREPGLRDIAQRLLVPRNAGEFWALAAALLALLTLLNQYGQTDEQTVIERVIHDPAPTVPRQEWSRPPD
jgi:hypothetical protein